MTNSKDLTKTKRLQEKIEKNTSFCEIYDKELGWEINKKLGYELRILGDEDL